MGTAIPGVTEVLALRIREHRQLHELTQADLADRLATRFGWNVDRSVINRIEAGKRMVTVEEMFLLAAALDTTPALLCTPADDSELMHPTPVRPMTADRVRAWIGDDVRLWEQDRDAYKRSEAAAWRRAQAQQDEFDRIGDALTAIYGVDSFEEIPPVDDADPRQRAAVGIISLRFALAGNRQSWEQQVGPWPHEDLDRLVAELATEPEAVDETAQRLWGQRPLDEIAKRNEGVAEEPVQSYEEGMAKTEHMLGTFRDVLTELAAELRKARTAARVPTVAPERPETRKRSSDPA